MGDATRGRAHLHALLELHRQSRGQLHSLDDHYQWFEDLTDVAREYLRAKELPEALKILGEAADLALPPRNNADLGLASTLGGLHRHLVALSAEERFKLLYEWSMPNQARPRVRILSSIVPVKAPPPVFARALGERPRDASFPISTIGDVHGLFSTAWSLVEAAERTGRLRRLTAELADHASRGVPQADTALSLARLAERGGEPENLDAVLRQRVLQLRQGIPPRGEGPVEIDPNHIVLAAACLTQRKFTPLGIEMLQSLVERTYGGSATRLRPFLRLAHARALYANRTGQDPGALGSPNLKYWIPASGQTAQLSAKGSVDATWLAHEEHILHLAGSRSDALFFRFPLAGDFEFTCETQAGGQVTTDGGLIYGGLQYEASGSVRRLTVWDADIAHFSERHCPFVHHSSRPVFNRLSLNSAEGGATFLVNRHPMWRDEAATASPWIALRSFDERRPIFRNLRLTGSPVIPRDVRLSDGPALRGWRSRFFDEQQPSPFTTEDSRGGDPTDWFLEQGEIRGIRQNAHPPFASPSRLAYQRPLLDGETISYEFLYELSKFEVHPAVGRLVFLIEKEGVRLRWITDGDREWTGLPDDNDVVEPFNRRGPRALPLKAGWNRVELSLAGNEVLLSLNGTVVYQRELDAAGDRIFSFYHDRPSSEARIRNAVLRGDWPERLPDDVTSDLVALDSPRLAKEQHAMDTIIGDQYLAENVFALRDRVSEMPLERRFATLLEWVLPGAGHPTFRLAGDFTPTHPAPSSADEDPLDSLRISRAEETGESRVEVGGNLASPALDLVEAAQSLGRLADLRKRVAEATVEHPQGSQVALLILIDLAARDFDQARAGFEQLLTLGDTMDHTEHSACWPEVLAVSWGLRHPQTRARATELLRSIFLPEVGRTQKGSSPAWNNYLAALGGIIRYLELEDTAIEQFWAAPGMRNWVPVSFTTSATRGQGRTRAFWHSSGNRVDNLSGHEQDYLFYRIPLRGNYEVECDVTAFNRQQSHLMVAGLVAAPVWDLQSYAFGDFRSLDPTGRIDPPLSKVDDWIRYRTVVRNGVSVTYFNGRKVHEKKLKDNHDPWLAIRSWCRHQGAVRDLRITGEPVVPDELKLTANAELTGWLPYYGETMGDQGHWRQLGELSPGGGIIGRKRPDLAGTWLESLLRYCRPMVEDGVIEYDFYYEPGQAAGHPALDRLALIVSPGGVREHWVTDGPYERTLSPSNVFAKPENRRGPRELPLISHAWNRMRLTLREDTISLHLNDLLVYERDLESTNLRTFGLFYFADQTELRVRNITWRGDWPRRVPPLEDQELAGEMADFLDHRLPELTAVFKHDFVAGGLPDEYFLTFGRDVEACVSVQPDGIHVGRPSGEEWEQAVVAARFRARGDFDLTATFARLETELPGHSAISLAAAIDDQANHLCRSIRNANAQRQMVTSNLTANALEGGRRTRASQLTAEADSGTLRLARRGETVYFLYAEGDSSVFRLVGAETVTREDLHANGVQLTVTAHANATTRVVWKDLQIRAERLLPIPPALQTPVLYLMNADGSGLRPLTEPIGDLGSHDSPDWSPDGRRIVFDTWNDTAASRIFIVNSDGTKLQDLGPGNMPTFSPDGKRIVFSWSGRGITVMQTDGSRRQVLVPNGWGAQWSPDGRSIAHSGNSVNLLDLATGTRRAILEGEHAERYSFIYWNLGWSADSRRICFLGRTRAENHYEVAVADVSRSSHLFQVLYRSESQPHPDFSWHPDGRTILFSMHDKQHRGRRIFTLDATRPGPPLLLATQPLDQNNGGVAWSPDGKVIAFSSQRLPTWRAESPLAAEPR